MNIRKNTLYRHCALALLCAATNSALPAQQTSTTAAPAPVPDEQASAAVSSNSASADDDTIVLSPFEVIAEEDTGYTATSTLAGTRLRTDLRDIASSLSVVTSQFIRDTGSTSNETLLTYQLNTEVGGLYGNFSGVGNVQAASENSKLANPNSNTRVRGLDEADNTRDYFLTSIPWDSYMIDRVDIQRGPNSILFGVGSPAGIINTTTIGARLDKSSGLVEATFDGYGSQRYNIDYNQLLIRNKLAVRIAAVDDSTQYRQDPAYADATRVFGAIRYTPQLFSSDYADKLSVRFNAEGGKLQSNRPRSLPPIDKISPFFDPTVFPRVNGKVTLYDPNYIWSYYLARDRGTKVTPAAMAADPRFKAVPGLGNEMGAGFFTYNNGASAPILVGGLKPGTKYGINSAGAIDQGIGAIPFGNYAQVAGLYEYSLNLNSLDPTQFPAASKAYYKDLVIKDPSVFDFYNNLLDGDNKQEWTDFETANLAVAQNFFGNRLGVEVVYDYQSSTTGQEGYLGGNPFISVDVNKYNFDTLANYYPDPVTTWATDQTTGGGTDNPNKGRAYTSGQGSGNSGEIERGSWRVTAYGELRGNDVFSDDSFLAKLFHRNVLSVLVSQDQVDLFNKAWTTERTDVNFPLVQGQTTAGVRAVGWTTYLSDDLSSRTSVQGLGLDRLRTTIRPYGQVQAKYFDSHWNHSLNPADPTYLDPAAPFTNPNTQQVTTQSENPANYVGWTSMAVDILSSSHGDMDQMYTNATKRTDTLDSKGLTLQSYLWDEMLIGTIGFRKDRMETYGSAGARDEFTQVVSIDFPNLPTSTSEAEGETTTWGVVARLPRSLRGTLPFGSDISAFYNNSENFRAVNRAGFDGKPLPPPRGTSEDFGFMVSTLEDRVSVKVTWFDTKVEDVDIPGGNALGQNTWFLGNMQAWGCATVQWIKAGQHGERPGDQWYWNYALIDGNHWGDPAWENPNGANYLNSPITAKQNAAVEAWIETMPDQAYFDALGYPVDVAKMQSSDWAVNKTAISNGKWTPDNGVGSIQSSTGGMVNGQAPVGTINQQSKGIEFEFAAKLARGWDMVFNVAKTDASRTGLGKSFASWIEGQKARLDGPAGDLRLWWGGDKTYREYYDSFIYQPYLFQKESDGSMAPEIRQWRFNLVSNYSFDSGALKGVNVGVGYRWQDKVILGYALDDTKTKLDIDRPIEGAAENALDCWVGYARKLSDKVGWRVQLNVRNVGDEAHLIPVSANPDGTYATMRVSDGMIWSLRNSFEF
jgi:outer membrane receptor protein involved in Fe transport